MGLLLSILVGCVGVLELLASLKQVTNEASNTSRGPTTPCLSYHDPRTDNPSFHDALCSISHSGDIPVPKGARRKLENLHEYSLRVRSELKSFGGSDWSTLSDCSTRDLLSPSRTDSRLSLNFDLALGDQEDAWMNRTCGSSKDEGTAIFVEVDRRPVSEDEVVIEKTTEPEMARLTMRSLTTADGVDEYVRVPTPIPLGMSQEISRSNSSLDLRSSFENESGNEAPTRMFFDQVPVVVSRYGDEESSSSPESSVEEDDISSRVRKRGFVRISRSRSPDAAKDRDARQDRAVVRSTPKFLTNEVNLGHEVSMKDCERVPDDPRTSEVVDEVDAGTAKVIESAQRRSRSGRTTSTVLRKPTRLKSKNAEISKSAENLTVGAKPTKRQREPERRRSDISVQTMKPEDWLRDEWTNTSPTDSEISISASRTSVSVEVQTSFDDREPLAGGIGDSRSTMSFEIPVIGLSESRRDVGVRDRDDSGRKAFRNRRFPNSTSTMSRSLDDCANGNWIPGSVDATVAGAFGDTTTDNRKRFDADKEQFERNDRESIRWRPSGNEATEEPKGSSRLTEEDSVDEEFLDAEEASTSVSGDGPVEYCIPSTDESDKPFWVKSKHPDENVDTPRALCPTHEKILSLDCPGAKT